MPRTNRTAPCDCHPLDVYDIFAVFVLLAGFYASTTTITITSAPPTAPPFIIHHHKNFHLIAASGRNKERKQRGRKNLDVVGFCLLGFDCDGGLSGKTPTWEWKSYLNRNRASRIGGFEGIEQMASWRRVLCVPTTNAPHGCACCSAGGTHPWPPDAHPSWRPTPIHWTFPGRSQMTFQLDSPVNGKGNKRIKRKCR